MSCGWLRSDNTVEVRQITIFVEAVPGAPVIDRFTVDPAQIMAGQCVDITWAISGNVTKVTLLRGNVDLWPGGAPVSGTCKIARQVRARLITRLKPPDQEEQVACSARFW